MFERFEMTIYDSLANLCLSHAAWVINQFTVLTTVVMKVILCHYRGDIDGDMLTLHSKIGSPKIGVAKFLIGPIISPKFFANERLQPFF